MKQRTDQKTHVAAAIGLFGSMFVLSTPVNAEVPDPTEWEFGSAVLWESKYVAEGRDELENSGIFSLELAAAYSGLAFSVWSAIADRVNYKELNLTVAYGYEWQGIEFVGGYTHLRFAPGSETDDELFLEMATDLPAGFRLSAGGVYSFEAEGTFWEVALGYPRSFVEERLWLEPYVLAGVDFGYRTSEHDGWNHVEVGISASYAIHEQLEILGYLKHSFAQRDVRREGLGDVSWAGVGLAYSF